MNILAVVMFVIGSFIAAKDLNSIFIRTELAKAFKEILSNYEMDMENI